MISTLGPTSPVSRPAAAASPGHAKVTKSPDVAAAGKVAASSDAGAVTLTTPPALIAAQGAPIDAAKVAAMRAQIANGTFQVSPQAIAAKMIAMDLPPQA